MVNRIDEALSRLRVCRAAGVAPSAELQDEILECLEATVGGAALRRRRDALIRRAALLLPTGSEFERAGVLSREAKTLGRMRSRSCTTATIGEPATPRECLYAASLLARLPGSQRQFYRVLTAQSH
jgi:hypothetical protein